MKRHEGYATFTTFVLILSFSGLFILLSSFLFLQTRSLTALKTEVEREAAFMDLALEICRTLSEDSSPEADSSSDTVWEVNERGYSQEFEVELTELSSRLNPNVDDLQFWKLTNLNSRIKSSFALSEWETERMNRFAYRQEDLEDMLFEEDWETLYSLRTLINANSAPLEVIEGWLRQTGTDENTISSILSKIRTKREAGDFISQQEIGGWFPGNEAPRSAVLNSQSRINVNFTDPLVLEAILGYPWNGEAVDNYLVMKNNILNARNSYEVTEEQLRGLMSCDEEIKTEILKYLGDTSWFWNLTVQDEEFLLDVLIGRVPALDDKPESAGIQIVNKRFIRKEE